jgi:hydrogenase maturation protease
VREDQIAAFTTESNSAHGWGVAETLRLGRKLVPSTLPLQIVLLGIEISQLEMGEKLSEQVQKNMPELVKAIQNEIKRLLHYLNNDRIHDQN